MGKEEYRFKLSDLIPNSWFYKLRDMRSRGSRESRASRRQTTQNFMKKSQISRTEPLSSQRRRPTSPPTHIYSSNRPSHYIPTKERAEKLPLSPINHKAIDTVFPLDSPRKSHRRHKEKPLKTSNNLISSVSSVLTCRNQGSSILSSHPSTGRQFHGITEDFHDEFIPSKGESNLNPPPLPTILTKPRLVTGKKQSPKQGNANNNGGIRRSPTGSHQIKMRVKSPKLAKKIAPKKKGLAESFVVVKSSSNPQREFRESMVEMIVENDLCSLKDLEELLACYLSLNSSEYHDLIVNVFKQIWFDLTELILDSQ